VRLYRFAGFTLRHIPGKNEHLSCVVELEHKASGQLYHYHKDFFTNVHPQWRAIVVIFFEAGRLLDGKTVAGWELR